MGSYAQGAQTAGARPAFGRAAGYGIFQQVTNIPAGGLASADFTEYLPDGAQLIDILLDTTTLHTSATATLSGGTTLGGTELWPATGVVTAGRVRPAFTGAQLLAMQTVPHTSGQPDTPVYMRLALGTPTSVGVTKVTLVYSLKLD